MKEDKIINKIENKQFQLYCVTHEKLLNEVDKIVKRKHTSSSSYTRQTLTKAIKEEKIKELEEQHIKDYMKNPNPQDDISLINENESLWSEFNDTW